MLNLHAEAHAIINSQDLVMKAECGLNVGLHIMIMRIS